MNRMRTGAEQGAGGGEENEQVVDGGEEAEAKHANGKSY